MRSFFRDGLAPIHRGGWTAGTALSRRKVLGWPEPWICPIPCPCDRRSPSGRISCRPHGWIVRAFRVQLESADVLFCGCFGFGSMSPRNTVCPVKTCKYGPFCGPDVITLFCSGHDDGRLAVIIGIGPLGRDLIRDVLRIVPDPPKEGRCTP